MALQIAEQAWKTDVGRQRSVNEDDLVARPPFFVVADGMGGAKAGEVASAMATDAFEGESDSDEPAEEQLARIVRAANRRIYDLAVSDESHRGMGTTLTAAKLDGGRVSLAHVGDSRAYRLREGELEQLTHDHSLVAELERSGQISPEAAEHHPQRSIITRALGPEPEVDVDTYTVAGREGDVFLLCSDGLTSMISDGEVTSILRSADSLEAAAESLVRAANQSGGKDNVTVVLFRLGGGEGEPPADDETIPGTITAADVEEAAVADAPTPTHGAEARAAAAFGDRPSDATVVAPPARTAPAPAVPRRRRRRLRTAFTALIGLVLVAGVIAGLYALSRQVYFLGTNDAGLVTLYRGVPYDVPFGIELYHEEYPSGVPARAIPAIRRKRVLDHEWRSREDAVDLLRALERGQLDTSGSRP